MNPYLDEARATSVLVEGWGDGEMVLPPNLGREEFSRRAYARNRLIYKYAHSIPSEEALEELAELSPIVELGAGGGYWAYLLRERGVEVVALDSDTKSNDWHEGHWTEVEPGSEYSVAEYPGHTLFLSWPMPELTWVLSYYEGDAVVYVGEYEGGVCANPGFFAQLERDFECERTIDLPRFWGQLDYMTVWGRR